MGDRTDEVKKVRALDGDRITVTAEAAQGRFRRCVPHAAAPPCAADGCIGRLRFGLPDS